MPVAERHTMELVIIAPTPAIWLRERRILMVARSMEAYIMIARYPATSQADMAGDFMWELITEAELLEMMRILVGDAVMQQYTIA